MTPAPPVLSLLPEFIGFSIVALRSNLSVLGLPPGGSQLSHIRPPFSLNGSLKFHLYVLFLVPARCILRYFELKEYKINIIYSR